MTPEWEHIVDEDGWERYEIILGHLYLDVSQSKDRLRWETFVNTEEGECLREGLVFTEARDAQLWILGVAAGVAQKQAADVTEQSVAVLEAMKEARPQGVEP